MKVGFVIFCCLLAAVCATKVPDNYWAKLGTGLYRITKGFLHDVTHGTPEVTEDAYRTPAETALKMGY